MNFYNLDPFTQGNYSDMDLTALDKIDLVGLPILNYTHINKDLSQLDGFYGFSPRWTLICKLRNITNPSLNTSAILLVIDSKKEIEIGLGK